MKYRRQGWILVAKLRVHLAQIHTRRFHDRLKEKCMEQDGPGVDFDVVHFVGLRATHK